MFWDPWDFVDRLLKWIKPVQAVCELLLIALIINHFTRWVLQAALFASFETVEGWSYLATACLTTFGRYSCAWMNLWEHVQHRIIKVHLLQFTSIASGFQTAQPCVHSSSLRWYDWVGHFDLVAIKLTLIEQGRFYVKKCPLAWVLVYLLRLLDFDLFHDLLDLLSLLLLLAEEDRVFIDHHFGYWGWDPLKRRMVLFWVLLSIELRQIYFAWLKLCWRKVWWDLIRYNRTDIIFHKLIKGCSAIRGWYPVDHRDGWVLSIDVHKAWFVTCSTLPIVASIARWLNCCLKQLMHLAFVSFGHHWVFCFELVSLGNGRTLKPVYATSHLHIRFTHLNGDLFLGASPSFRPSIVNVIIHRLGIFLDRGSERMGQRWSTLTALAVLLTLVLLQELVRVCIEVLKHKPSVICISILADIVSSGRVSSLALVELIVWHVPFHFVLLLNHDRVEAHLLAIRLQSATIWCRIHVTCALRTRSLWRCDLRSPWYWDWSLEDWLCFVINPNSLIKYTVLTLCIDLGLILIHRQKGCFNHLCGTTWSLKANRWVSLVVSKFHAMCQ